jgi:hypothetical protein
VSLFWWRESIIFGLPLILSFGSLMHNSYIPKQLPPIFVPLEDQYFPPLNRYCAHPEGTADLRLHTCRNGEYEMTKKI